MLYKRRCQIAAEFLIFIGIALIVTVVFISLSAGNAKELYSRREYFLVRDTALMIQNEIDIASQVVDGYERDFTLPDKLNSVPYNISIRNNVLSVWSENTAYVIALPNSTGNLTKGTNKITKINNVIFIN